MTEIIEKRSEIPDAPAYVLSNDTFTSGWGWAEGKTNTCIWPCQSTGEAFYVAAMVSARSDMARVRVVFNKPRLRSHIVYSLFNREESKRYYTLWMTITYYPREKVYRIRWGDPEEEKAAQVWGLYTGGIWLWTDTLKEAVFECIKNARNLGTRSLSIEYGLSTLTEN